MSLSDLKPPKGAKHAKKRIGRGQGSGQGKTAGRGHKGAKSRSGYCEAKVLMVRPPSERPNK